MSAPVQLIGSTVHRHHGRSQCHETRHLVYSLRALFTGAVGVALALRVPDTARLSCLVPIGVDVWLLGSTSVFIGITLILGRLLVGTSLDTFPVSASPYSTFAQQATRTREHT